MAERRLFFALWPSDRQREQLRDPIKAVVSAIEGDAVPRGNWHVTLVFLGDFPVAEIPALADAAAAVEPGSFRLRFDRLEYWPRPKIACLLATAVPPQVVSLVDELKRIGADFGIEPEERSYRPHLTVARRVRHFPSEPLAQPVTLDWSGFQLIESLPTSHGVEYRPLKQGLRGDS